MLQNTNETEFDYYQIDIDLSRVKKEKLLRQRRKELREKLRADLPVLTANDIRRCRLPYNEAVLADLADAGYIHTVEFIQQLFTLQEKIRRRVGPSTTIWLRPQLIYSAKQLDHLSKGLTKAEKAHNEGDFATEWDEIMRLAAHYAFGSDDWWWLGEQLLYQTVSMEYSPEHKKQEAISYYIIGKYLVGSGKKVESGKYYLELVREMSVGKSWNCKKILKGDQDTVFTASCKLLYNVLMEEALSWLQIDPMKTVQLSATAKRRAVEACDKEGDLKALLLKAKGELKLHLTTDTIGTAIQALNRSTKRKYVVGMCEAKITLSLAYLQYGNYKECFKCLRELEQLGHEHQLPFYVGQAYRYMGEYYLNQQNPKEATPLLMLAFYIFHDARDVVRREKVRNWGAIAAGEELFPAYIQLIKKCRGNGTRESNENTNKLIEWLDDREFFWVVKESKFSFSKSSLMKSVSESCDVLTDFT